MINDGDDDQEFETNAEGLTRTEEAKCLQAFKAFDRTGSGFVDVVELRILLEMMGRKLSEDEVYALLDNQKHSKQISYAEFRHVIA